MKKKKVTKKTAIKKENQPLKDFDLIAHTINIEEGTGSFKWGDSDYKLIALYLNKYGAEIGGTCRDVKTGRIISMDSFLHEEFIADGGEFC